MNSIDAPQRVTHWSSRFPRTTFDPWEILEDFRSVSQRRRERSCRPFGGCASLRSQRQTIRWYLGAHPVLWWFTSTRHPLCAIDIYGAIYILPNILSLGKWPQARAKLLNIQAGNEAKFVCVSARSRHWYTSGSSSSALLPDCILSRDGIILYST